MTTIDLFFVFCTLFGTEEACDLFLSLDSRTMTAEEACAVAPVVLS